MKTSLKKMFNEINKTNKFGHAYLIYDVDFPAIKNDLENVINSFLMKEKRPLTNNPDVHLITLEKSMITKEQIIDLQKEISLKSQINDNVVYIITCAEKLNTSAANCLLKTLEEPEEFIYAFLITSNIEKVISTIKSRCILIKLNDQVLPLKDMYDQELIDITLIIINIIENEIIISQGKIYQLLKKMKREDVFQVFEIMNYFYKDCISILNNKKIEYLFDLETTLENVAKNNNSKKIIKKILILNEENKKLYYNVNINLFIDNLIKRFSEV